MEVGGYIYCHTTGYMADGDVFAYAGREYLIERIVGDELTVITECGPDHCWPMDDPMFSQHFSTEKIVDSWAGNILKFRFL